MQKSVNQQWKESNTTLGFTEWLERESLKGTIAPKEFVDNSLTTIRELTNVNPMQKAVGMNIGGKFIGLNKWVIGSALLIVTAALVYKYSKKAQ